MKNKKEAVISLELIGFVVFIIIILLCAYRVGNLEGRHDMRMDINNYLYCLSDGTKQSLCETVYIDRGE